MGSFVSLGARVAEVMVPCQYLQLVDRDVSAGADDLEKQQEIAIEMRKVADLMENLHREHEYTLPPTVAALHLTERNEQLALTILHHSLPEFLTFLLQGERSSQIQAERSLRALARISLHPNEVREMQAIFQRAKERCSVSP